MDRSFRLLLRGVAVAVAVAATLGFAGSVIGDVLPSPVPSPAPTPLPAAQQPVLSWHCVPGKSAFNVVVRTAPGDDFFTGKSGTFTLFYNFGSPSGRFAPFGTFPWRWEPNGTLLSYDISFGPGRPVDAFWILRFDNMPQVENLPFEVTGCTVSTPPSPSPSPNATASPQPSGGLVATSTTQPGLPNTGARSS